MFKEVGQDKFPKLEEEILAFWKDKQIFEQSSLREGPEFVFYEGPPTANGQPAMHHVLARAFKDLFPRYKSMRGFHITRKGGWDTHGLPVEISVEKKLGLLGRSHDKSRAELEEFNRLCRDSVFENIQDWKFFTERMGYWVNLEDAYVTYHNEYIESVWNLLKRLWDKGLITQDYKVVPLSPRISTTLSANEIADGYKEVDDPSVYVRFPLKLESTPDAVRLELEKQGVKIESLANLALLVWTTTPWTLPSNTMAAVNPALEYVVANSPMGPLVVAAEAMERVASLHPESPALEVRAKLKGSLLEYWEYQPPFPEVAPELGVRGKMHFVALADFVSTEDGSGIAHEAPVYGAEDLVLSRQYGVPLIFGTDDHGIMQATTEKGKF
ncbi:MAG: class I tRNA ligase family protein, partial [Deinococcus sp.]|nr:class I tRNA ligase family protein [Deinococcus sp.]